MVTAVILLKFIGFTHQCSLRKKYRPPFLNSIRALGLIFYTCCTYIYNTRFRPFFLLVSFLDLLQWVPCFIVSIVVLFLLHVIVTCVGRHMELEPSAKQIGWVLRNQHGLSRPNSFWTSSAAKRWCLPWRSRSRHEHWAPDWVFLWKVDRVTPYYIDRGFETSWLFGEPHWFISILLWIRIPDSLRCTF